MVYLVECHWGKKILFKDGFDGRFILGVLLGSDVVFKYGIKDGYTWTIAWI